MKADEFVKKYAELAPSVESFTDFGGSLKGAEIIIKSFFVEKRLTPIDFDDSLVFDETLRLIRDYNVNSDYRLVYGLHLHVFDPRTDELDFFCMMNRAIPIGRCFSDWCVINYDTKEIEIRPVYDFSPEVVDNEQGMKVAKNGSSFFDAIMKFSPTYQKVLESSRRRYVSDQITEYTQEEKETMLNVMPGVIELAGGELYRPFWYYVISTIVDE